jgi:hypothetical protein
MRGNPRTAKKQILAIHAQLDELHSLAARQGLLLTAKLTESRSARRARTAFFSKFLHDANLPSPHRFLHLYAKSAHLVITHDRAL